MARSTGSRARSTWATWNKSRDAGRLNSGWDARRKPQTWRGHGEGEAGNSGSMLPACVATLACKPRRALQGGQRREPPEIKKPENTKHEDKNSEALNCHQGRAARPTIGIGIYC